jgi:hypothetical protein
MAGRLPNLVSQDQIIINQKSGNSGYRSHNVSKKRGMLNQGQPHTANKININENFIWAKNEEGNNLPEKYDGYASATASKRVKTSDKWKGNKLLYRRNKESYNNSKAYPKGEFNMYAPMPKSKNYARSNIDTNDVFYYKKVSNISPEPPKIENEVQGNQMKTFYSNNDENFQSKHQTSNYHIGNKKNSEGYNRPNFTDMVYTNKYFNNIESPNLPNQKQNHIIKRNRRKNKTNRHMVAMYPSPYQSKDAKLNEIKKTYGLSYKNMFEPGQAAVNFTSTVRPVHKPKVDSLGGAKTTHHRRNQNGHSDQVGKYSFNSDFRS